MTEVTHSGAPDTANRAHLLPRLRWIIILSTLSISALYAGYPIYSSQFNASGFQIGAFYSIGALMAAISRPVFGRALDRYGRKPMLLLGIGMMVVALILFSLADTLTLLFFASFAHGLALGTILLASYTITYDLTDEQGRGGSFGQVEESQYRGAIYGAVIALPILLLTGFAPGGELHITRQVWFLAFIVYAVGAGIGLALAWFTVPETHDLVKRHLERDDAVSLGDRKLNTVLLVVLLTSASAYSIQPFILQFVEKNVTSNVTWIGLCYIPSAIANGLLPSRFGRWSDRVGRKPPMIAALVISGFLSLAVSGMSLAFGPGSVTLKLLVFGGFLVLESFAYAASIPAEQALVADITGGKKRGTALGMYTLAQSMGRAVGPLFMGTLAVGFKEGPFIANAIILAIGAVIVWFGIYDPGQRGRN